MILEVVQPRWRSCIVAAPGPSLFPVYDGPIIVVQDAWRMIPWADVLYGCEPRWWRYHKGTTFTGEKWSTHHDDDTNNKTEAQEKWGVRCVKGDHKNEFSLDPSVIHYGNNSGFQAVNLAILFGCTHITLVGFDMKGSHFFGDHPKDLDVGNSDKFPAFLRSFEKAAKALPDHIRIVNATPGSALTCFPMMTFKEAMKDVHHHLDGGLPDSRGVHWEGEIQGSRSDQPRDGAEDSGKGNGGQGHANSDEEEACIP